MVSHVGDASVEFGSLKNYPAPPTVASATSQVRRSVAHGHELSCFSAASAVELEVISRRSDMQQGIEI